MTEKNILKLTNSLHEAETEKGKQYLLMKGNTVEMGGSLYRVFSSRLWTEAVVEGRKVKVPIDTLRFYPVDAGTVKEETPKPKINTAKAPKGAAPAPDAPPQWFAQWLAAGAPGVAK